MQVAIPFFKKDVSTFDLTRESYPKMLFCFLFANATFADFENPIEFIEKRKNLLNDNIINLYENKIIPEAKSATPPVDLPSNVKESISAVGNFKSIKIWD